MSADQPLITHLYTADPSAHVFDGRLYIYPSHDRETGIADNDNGDQYDMADYHVFSLDRLISPLAPSPSDSTPPPVTDHGAVLSLASVPWASKQLWAPDAACKNGRYYLYFPARDSEGVFRIGVAEGPSPSGPFTADESFIEGTYSIDPASFVDEEVRGAPAYLYFGGIWGGQLQCWQTQGRFDAGWTGPKEPTGAGVKAMGPRVARLTEDMHGLAEAPREIEIVDESTGEPIEADDHERRFFEAAWMHRYKGKYYFSYSTGDTHLLAYAVGESPYGPFTYRGAILGPVLGWTTHHSIVEFKGRWWLFYHDCSLSGGKNHLRSVKAREIVYDAEGNISLAEQQKPVQESAARLEG